MSLPPTGSLPPLPPLPPLPSLGLPPSTTTTTTIASAPPMESPQSTVYVNHLVQKGISVDTIKAELRALFETYGTVIDVHAVKHYKTRGQAWVIFDSIPNATKAIEGLNGYIYHGRAFQCNFARNKSDRIAKADGTYVERKKRKRNELEGEDSSSSSSSASLRAAPKHEERVGPHRILFARELPDECTKDMLDVVFSTRPGFKEIRFLPNRNVAFIEFTDIPSANSALSLLKHHELVQLHHKLRLNFAKQ